MRPRCGRTHGSSNANLRTGGQSKLKPTAMPDDEPRGALSVAPVGRAEWGTTALRAAHGVAQVGHSRRGDGVDQLQADLPELDAVE
jgi:hypothetical protein